MFGYTSERRMERALIAQYEKDFKSLAGDVHSANLDMLIELALLPLSIRGFGPVKQENEKNAQARRAEILEMIHNNEAKQHAAE